MKYLFGVTKQIIIFKLPQCFDILKLMILLRYRFAKTETIKQVITNSFIRIYRASQTHLKICNYIYIEPGNETWSCSFKLLFEPSAK